MSPETRPYSPTDHQPTPYDTGARAEPKLWQPDIESVRAAMRHADEREHIGKVDFDDDEGHTTAVVYLERDEHGEYRLHVTPLCAAEEFEVVVHDEAGDAEQYTVC